MKNNLQAKRIVITAGEVQLPIKVGEEVCYRYDGHLMLSLIHIYFGDRWNDQENTIYDLDSAILNLVRQSRS